MIKIGCREPARTWPAIRHSLFVLLLFVLAVTDTGCMLLLHSFKPDDAQDRTFIPAITLPESLRTIDVRVKVDPFINKVPDKNAPWGQRDITSPRFTNGNLTHLVSQAILIDFYTNLVFTGIRRNEINPDLILTGIIYRFSERHTAPWYSLMPPIRVFAPRIGHYEGEVDLEVILTTPAGVQVGSYRGKSSFSYEVTLLSGGSSTTRQWGDRLNEHFSAAVRQIREQLLGDRDQISAQVAPSVPSWSELGTFLMFR